MSLLEELNIIMDSISIQVHTGVFDDEAPDEYAVLTPMSDVFDLFADNKPHIDVQEVRISLFCKANYKKRKNEIVQKLMNTDITITDRRYIGYEDDTKYHHYGIDVAKEYNFELHLT